MPKDLNGQKHYWDEVRSICEDVIDEAMQKFVSEGRDAAEEHAHEYLWETIDGHQWIIYNAYHLPILQYSDNENAYQDEMGEMPQANDISELHMILAFYALRADVQECLSERLYEKLDRAEGSDYDEDEDDEDDEPRGRGGFEFL